MHLFCITLIYLVSLSTANIAKTSKLSAMELKKKTKKGLIVQRNRGKSFHTRKHSHNFTISDFKDLEIFFLTRVWKIKENKNSWIINQMPNCTLLRSSFIKIYQFYAIKLCLEIVYTLIFNGCHQISEKSIFKYKYLMGK